MEKSYLQKIIEYSLYMTEVKIAKRVEHPFGYCCGSCNATFSNYQARNYHVWLNHPGCAKYRKNTFWDWLFGQNGIYHSCICQSCGEKKCDECNSKFIGAYR